MESIKLVEKRNESDFWDFNDAICEDGDGRAKQIRGKIEGSDFGK